MEQNTNYTGSFSWENDIRIIGRRTIKLSCYYLMKYGGIEFPYDVYRETRAIENIIANRGKAPTAPTTTNGEPF